MKKLFFLSLFFAACNSQAQIPPIEQPDGEPKIYHFPHDFTNDLIGQEVTIANELVVTTTYRTSQTGSIRLSSELLSIPTERVLPGSNDYKQLLESNLADQLILNSGSYPLADAQTNTLRIGAKLSNLKGKVAVSGDNFTFTLTDQPVVSNNERPALPQLGNHNMKVASMNLEFYMASPSAWGNGNGAKTEEAFQRQRAKIVAAMLAMDADVYAICEIEEGSYSVAELTEALNQAAGSATRKYRWIDSGDSKVTNYTKNTFIYNSETVTTHKEFKLYNGSYLRLRHIVQCFELRENGARVILAMNHFKSKGGGNATGGNKDQFDGQSQFNERRLSEAKDCLATYAELMSYYGDSDVLVLGDLNSYSLEDPIRLFTDAGYTNELTRFAPQAYSYTYRGEVGNLDHSLSSPSLTSQVTGASPWDINASEPLYLEYPYADYFTPTPYRYSDHNPILTGLQLVK